MGINIQKSADKINGHMKKSAQWIIDVGNELMEVQSFGGTREMEKLYELLPFGKSVGDKIISIAMDEFIKKNVDIVPSAYNTLYDLLLSKKITDKTGCNASLLWDKFGDKNMFGGEKFNFTLKDMNINPTSTYKEIEALFKAIKLCVGSKKDAGKNGSGGIEGVFTFKDIDELAENAKAFKKAIKDTSSKDAPAKDAPAKDAPAKDVTSKDAPAKDATSKDAPVKDATSKDAPKEPSVIPLVKARALLSIVFDEDIVTNNEIQLDLLKLQNKVQELITGSLNGLVEVKTWDVPVVNAQVKVAVPKEGDVKKVA